MPYSAGVHPIAIARSVQKTGLTYNNFRSPNSPLLRVFGAFAPVPVEQRGEQVSGQRDTVTSDRNEQVIYILKQEIEHLNTLLASRDSHIDSLKQAMLLLENREEKRQNTTRPRAWWRFWQS